MNAIIETYGYARAGFLGNPSDGYFGKTISFCFQDFRARVLMYPSARLEIKFSKADLPVFEDIDDLYRITRWRILRRNPNYSGASGAVYGLLPGAKNRAAES